MADAENALPPSKKRAAGRELSRDNPGLDDDEETSEQEAGTFKRASEEVLASRRIVRVRRNQTSSAPPASSNPFAAIRLVPAIVATSTPSEVAIERGSGVVTVPEEVEGKEDVNEGNEEEKEDVYEGSSKEQEEQDKVSEEEIESTRDLEKTDAVNEATKQGIADENEKEGDKPKNGDKKDGDSEEKEEHDKVSEEETESTRDLEKTDALNEATKQGIVDENEKEGDKSENGDKKDGDSENTEEISESPSLSSFQQLSSTQNAFTGVAGTGFSSSSFSFGIIPRDGSSVDSGSGSGLVSGVKNDPPSFPSFGFGSSNNGSSLFASTGPSICSQSTGSGFPSMKEVPVETGEENEKALFTADSVLFEFLDGGWKERGKGELKVNVSTTRMEKARLVMRTRGNFRLILNASLYPDMKLTDMEKRGVTFACVNSASEGKDGLCTFALKFKDASVVEEFRGVVTEHKGKTVAVLKIPENSPKASDD